MHINTSREDEFVALTCARGWLLTVQKQDGQQSGTVLDQRDELFIVHVCSPKASGGKKDNWKAGGALMHSMEVSKLLQNFRRMQCWQCHEHPRPLGMRTTGPFLHVICFAVSTHLSSTRHTHVKPCLSESIAYY